MRHRLRGRQLSRTTSHRIALFRNLSRALITHERIVTTVPKAKELRPFFEKLVTLAKKAAQVDTSTPEGKALAVHYRRLAASKLGPTHGTGVYEKNGDAIEDKTLNTVLKKLFNDIGKRYVDRPGGYTRILKRMQRRLGDAGETALIELVGSEVKTETAVAPVAPEVKN